jgi:hypothetical protein
LALAAGFLLIVFGANASSIAQFLAHPTIESHPYRLTPDAGAVRDVTDCRIGLAIPVTQDCDAELVP